MQFATLACLRHRAIHTFITPTPIQVYKYTTRSWLGRHDTTPAPSPRLTDREFDTTFDARQGRRERMGGGNGLYFYFYHVFEGRRSMTQIWRCWRSMSMRAPFGTACVHTCSVIARVFNVQRSTLQPIQEDNEEGRLPSHSDARSQTC